MIANVETTVTDIKARVFLRSSHVLCPSKSGSDRQALQLFHVLSVIGAALDMLTAANGLEGGCL